MNSVRVFLPVKKLLSTLREGVGGWFTRKLVLSIRLEMRHEKSKEPVVGLPFDSMASRAEIIEARNPYDFPIPKGTAVSIIGNTIVLPPDTYELLQNQFEESSNEGI